MKSNLNEKEIINKSKNFDKNVFIMIIIVAIIVISIIYFLPKYGYDDVSYIALIVLIIFGIFNKFVLNYINDNKRKKMIKNELFSKFGVNDIIINKKPKLKIVYRDKTRVGNIRNKYVFSVFLKKYKCEFVSYSKEVLERYWDAYSVSFLTYRYVKLTYLNEYIYDLSEYGISFSSEDLKNDEIQKNINEIKNIKNIEISIKDNKLIIAKETMKNNYMKEFASLDVNDIEYFYNMIVKQLKEVKLNGTQSQNFINNNN